MSTTLMYHAFGLKAYRYIRAEYFDGAIFFHVKKKEAYQYCTNCRSRDVTFAGRVESIWHSLPIGFKPTIIVAHLHRLNCHSCGLTRLESLEVADPRKGYTRPFCRYVVEMARHMTKSAIAAKLKFVGWNTIKAIITDDLNKRLKRRRLNKVRLIAIDEMAIRKGHRYLSNVVDLETGEVIYSVEGRDTECLRPFFTKIKRSRKARLEAIAVDMSSAYLKAIELYAPAGVKIIHDRYHLVANMNRVLDEIRRDEYRRKSGAEKTVMKGSRYLLLAAFENIYDDEDKYSRLESLLGLNETIHKAYLLKEDLRMFWEQGCRKDAQQFIKTWLKEARSMENSHLDKMANTIEKHMEQILNHYTIQSAPDLLKVLTTKSKSSNVLLTALQTWNTSNSASSLFAKHRLLCLVHDEPVTYAKLGRTCFLRTWRSDVYLELLGNNEEFEILTCTCLVRHVTSSRTIPAWCIPFTKQHAPFSSQATVRGSISARTLTTLRLVFSLDKPSNPAV